METRGIFEILSDGWRRYILWQFQVPTGTENLDSSVPSVPNTMFPLRRELGPGQVVGYFYWPTEGG